MDDHLVLESHFPLPSRAATTTRETRGTRPDGVFVPHRGCLRRIHSADTPRPRSSSSASDDASTGSKTSDVPSASLSFFYAIPIVVRQSLLSGPGMEMQTHELIFERHEYEFISRLFSILDTESRGAIGQIPILEFVQLRCPVFRRRDSAIMEYRRTERISSNATGDINGSHTFDEVWNSVVSCCAASRTPSASMPDVAIGVEGWMVFCRFVALAQYQEAKRRFSARHLQQTMRPKSGGRGSEVVLVNVPPPEPPAPVTAVELASYELHCKAPIALPELDLDHCLVSTHDTRTISADTKDIIGRVNVTVFGPGRNTPIFSSSSTSPSAVNDKDNIEFILTYTTNAGESTVIVRRSFSDLKWLNDTFASHKSPGGTLCGRILPPFPKRAGSKSSSDYDKGTHSSGVVVEGGKAAMAAASAGVGMIKSVAKSFWGNSSTTTKEKKPKKSSSGESKLVKLGNDIKSTFRQPLGNERLANASSSKARQLERYLNYLLEHPALSTSFPLNTILKASQSGLDSAKSVLDSSAHLRGREKQLENMAESERGKNSSYLSSLLAVGGISGANQPNLSWVRTAAQAAMALKLHGVLETTGMPSASAKLQHASLPSFKKPAKGDEDASDSPRSNKSTRDCALNDVEGDDQSFENGVVSVKSALQVESDPCDESDGYDMLPAPLPLKERSVLCAGSIDDETSRTSLPRRGETLETGEILETTAPISIDEPRFHYGSRRIDHSKGDDENSTVLGDMSVDKDIDRLREIIGSVDNTLERCLAASTLISDKQRKRDNFHRNIVRGLDGWEGLRGEIVSQRALLDGVSTLERGIESSENSLLASNDDLSWQASLASAAVSAAEDVRCAVRAARTATGAKVAAEAAAETAQRICRENDFSTVNEARAAQTRASIAQSHAIHATVIEHEAFAAKRRAAMALAHDVKCWNVHRKRELLRMCRSMASSQRQACQQSAEAWLQLRNGLIDSSFVSVTEEKRESNAFESGDVEPVDSSFLSAVEGDGVGMRKEVTAQAERVTGEPFAASSFDDAGGAFPQINVREGEGTEMAKTEGSSPTFDGDVAGSYSELNIGDNVETSVTDRGPYDPCLSSSTEIESGCAFAEPSVFDPRGQGSLTTLLAASKLSDDVSALISNPLESVGEESHISALALHPPSVTEESAQAHEEGTGETEPKLSDPDLVGIDGGSVGQCSQGMELERGIGGSSNDHVKIGRDAMTESMQSLVDGLMNWGGQYDSSQDFSLPSGMAVSIALEENEGKTNKVD
uniref:PX domain-containing protein n=1 Tax=Odontella aurita TaxID=265563 RepID=A0A6U6J1P3_9STRA|mmetsp:Transcript_55281/g.165673  ORF Transcript_55281/g.165673 Transcript_55281/m.165673 type:complete len:1263 (+) Transcript_55281:369-4157(+)